MKRQRDPLLARLDAMLTDAFARRALIVYEERQPEVLFMVRFCCDLVMRGQDPGHILLAENTLRQLATGDCGLFHLTRDLLACLREDSEDSEAIERSQHLVTVLYKLLPRGCRRLADLKQPPRNSDHPCVSFISDKPPTEQRSCA